jgi:hypothetical protein
MVSVSAERSCGLQQRLEQLIRERDEAFEALEEARDIIEAVLGRKGAATKAFMSRTTRARQHDS